MFKLLPYLKQYKKECILAPIFKLFEAVLELILPTIMALVINNGVMNHDSHYVIKMGVLMVCMALLGYASSLVCQYMASKTSQGFGTILRNALFKHISSFSYSELDKFGTSSLINRVTNDVNQLQVAVAMALRLVSRAPFICIGAIIMAMILDFKLSLILLCTAPFFAVILYFFMSKTSPMYVKYQSKLDKLGVILRENLMGVRVIRSFVKTPHETKRFNEANDDLTQTAIRVGKISALLNPLTSLVMNFAIIVLLYTGAIQINAGRLSPGTIITFINYITQILLALLVVSNLIILFTKASASAKRINEVLETQPSITENDKKVEEFNTDNIIEFKNVSFKYNNDSDMAIENISLNIKRGQTIGIIGGTGSGKSTLINLIPRFYDVTNGEILLNGNNIKDYSLNNLREKISIVPQKIELFTGTIAENLRYGNPEASLDELKSAAETAQASEFINTLEKGFDTLVERGGANFSGGQRQRLAIARALVKVPDILILDDSSSALDFATDAALRHGIKHKFKDATVLIVSQRASTIKYSDKILVLDDGKAAGFGTHDELMKNCRVYKEICMSQLSSEEASK